MATDPLSYTLPIDVVKSVATLRTNRSGWCFCRCPLNTRSRRWIEPYSRHLQRFCTLRRGIKSGSAANRRIFTRRRTRDREGLRYILHFRSRSCSMRLRKSQAARNVVLLDCEPRSPRTHREAPLRDPRLLLPRSRRLRRASGAPLVIMLPEVDNFANPAGVKGLGEIGDVGTNAAVASAFAHRRSASNTCSIECSGVSGPAAARRSGTR